MSIQAQPQPVKKVSVEFVRRHGCYFPGDKAGFVAAVARRLCALGKAKLREPSATAAVKPGDDGANDIRKELKALPLGELQLKALDYDVDPTEHAKQKDLIEAVVAAMFERGANAIA